MGFYDKMKEVNENVSFTENGMEGYKHTEHALVDFNFKVSSYRNNIVTANSDFNKILSEKEPYALKYLFYLRDVREGMGERALFRSCLKAILWSNVQNKDEILQVILKNTAEYGRWDDLWFLLDTEQKDLVVELIKNQLKADFTNYKAKKSVSLLAKWLPSENASSKNTRRLAKLLIKELGISERQYRHTLSTLRKYLDVIEVKTSANEWDKIDYNAVPSKANLKYRNAFLKHDEERRRQFLAKFNSGDKTVKINMSVSYPHEIVSKYSTGGWYSSAVSAYDDTLEAYWKALKPCVGLEDTIVVRDGSGSMLSKVSNNVTALDISTALAIYCSQYLQGDFKDKFITFSARAQLINLSKCGTLHSKLEKVYREDDCSNTNIQNVFELILKTAVESHMKPEEIPSTVLIISDMEFDGYNGRSNFNGNSNVFKAMSVEYKAAGYELPKLVFWNVNSRTGTIPCRYNKNGVLLISGFSTNILKMVMNGKTDPYESLITELEDERYANIPLLTYASKKAEVKKEKNIPDFLK